ncbi:hypothetical protein Rleg4DRAFT_4050 [Rhizobium leguminosarum bv. trifolii WSM2297]|uniref:Uncharacterized protein n=1 Tax=Rhizobium leguminosarum bv. trifolii WSM2297 TaxID=754762 RepID=J0W9C4_RHILT|nr:hypothetical protein [Rhizobium leguminosarum]EJC82341.1 hypothetical protein Rleg4DRAFT_4050 [Rhizobium leguminosarum bv. trifolii WSM2297]
MQVSSPPEGYPQIGTVANPAVLYDGNDAFVCYETSGREGGDNVVLKFAEVIDFRITPMTIHGLKECRYVVNPWAFNEIIGGEETAKWKVLNPRLWLISFNDVMIEVLFETVALISRDAEGGAQHTMLIDVLHKARP